MTPTEATWSIFLPVCNVKFYWWSLVPLINVTNLSSLKWVPKNTNTSMAKITINSCRTNMHSSMMRTARLLPVSLSMHCAGGAPRGCVCSQGGLLLGGVCHSPLWTEWQTGVKTVKTVLLAGNNIRLPCFTRIPLKQLTGKCFSPQSEVFIQSMTNFFSYRQYKSI